jgi:hypothetical protein
MRFRDDPLLNGVQQPGGARIAEMAMSRLCRGTRWIIGVAHDGIADGQTLVADADIEVRGEGTRRSTASSVLWQKEQAAVSALADRISLRREPWH